MFKTIILALDGSEPSSGPARYATKLAQDFDGRVVVVHVNQLIAGRGAGPVHVDETDRQAHVRRQVAEMKAAGLEVEFVRAATVRTPARSIAETAKVVGADVIVTGATEHGPLIGALTGDTPQALLHMAPCPVLVASSLIRSDEREPIAA
ncbi:MAG TPA: universal stress protein [Gaiellales bacterium]|jgi:nucleotide-binding universal stress UspA family protein